MDRVEDRTADIEERPSEKEQTWIAFRETFEKLVKLETSPGSKTEIAERVKNCENEIEELNKKQKGADFDLDFNSKIITEKFHDFFKENPNQIVKILLETTEIREIIQKYGYDTTEIEKLREDMTLLRWFLKPDKRILKAPKSELDSIRKEEKTELSQKISLKYIYEIENLGELNTLFLFYLGCEQLGRGESKRALETFDYITLINTNLKGAWVNKGVALGYMKKFDKEIECYNKAIMLDKNYASAWKNKGSALKNLGNKIYANNCFLKAKRLEALYMFSWDNVPGSDSERLLRSLRNNFDIDWAEKGEIQKNEEGNRIHITNDEKLVKILVDKKKEKAELKINDDRTYDLKVEKEEFFFSWGNVPGIDSELFLRFLRDDYKIDWLQNADIRKTNNETIIISKDTNSATISLEENKKKAQLKISDGQTYDLLVKKEEGMLNIYESNGKLYIYKIPKTHKLISKLHAVLLR